MTEGAALVRIASGDLILDLAPAVGGAIARFRWRDFDLLRPATPAALAARDVLAMAAYPMAPYCGRIVDRSFAFDGREHRLADNFGGHPHSIHGNAWQRPWRVVRREPAACILALAHAAPDPHWPFAYSASQIFALDDAGLTFEIALRNDASEPFPVGLGLHPFFRRTPDTEIRARAEAIWENDERMTPIRRSAVPLPLDFSHRRKIGEIEIDNGYSGWDGQAEIAWPERGVSLRLQADGDAGHVVVYAPKGGDFVCIEPASATGDGFNKFARGEPETGVKVLAPGEIFAVRVRFDILT